MPSTKQTHINKANHSLLVIVSYLGLASLFLAGLVHYIKPASQAATNSQTISRR